ncbi:MAG TPA: hypothetical protein DEP69_04240, partial [Acidimicrobiaceae bacterium]|nr:hypothetical protein [Acidimicrobiaceae bacterium]
MIVCQCLALNDADIGRVLERWADAADAGAAASPAGPTLAGPTLADIESACGAGGDCAQCLPLIQDAIDELVARRGAAAGTGTPSPAADTPAGPTPSPGADTP